MYFYCIMKGTQYHVFEHWQPIRLKSNIFSSMKLDAIYGTLSEQLEAIIFFENIGLLKKPMEWLVMVGFGWFCLVFDQIDQ